MAVIAELEVRALLEDQEVVAQAEVMLPELLELQTPEAVEVEVVVMSATQMVQAAPALSSFVI